MQEWRFDDKDPSALFDLPDIPKLFRAAGAKVEVEAPSKDDFDEAHRRACLHLPPRVPDAKSDKMRDLVIWVMAVRLAKDGGAILVSRDEVHTHVRGDDEASAAGVLRAKSIDEALDSLGVETPVVKLVADMLKPIWSDIRDESILW